MHQNLKVAILLSVIFIVSNSVFAQFSIYSITDGAWDQDSTWNLDRIPLPTDRVLIQHKVDVNSGAHNVTEIEVNNANANTVWLRLRTPDKFTVAENVHLKCIGNGNVDLIVEIGDTFNIGGNLNMDRMSENSSNARMEFYSDYSAQTIVNGDFNFNYAGISSIENHYELEFYTRAKLLVKGDMEINSDSGKGMIWNIGGQSEIICEGNFSLTATEALYTNFFVGNNALFEVQNIATINNHSQNNFEIDFNVLGVCDIKKEFNLNSVVDDSPINLNVNQSGSSLQIGMDFNIDGGSEQDVILNLNDNSQLSLGGNLLRAGGFGVLNMANNATWKYNGTGTQTVACTDGTGTDQLNFTNIEFENDGGKMILEGDLLISEEVNLMSGVLVTSTDALLILNDDVDIFGAGPTAYVEGPVKLVHTGVASSFKFPLGESGVYAPMTISTSGGRAAGGEYIAQYYNCPPPWEVDEGSNLSSITNQEFWTLSRPEDAPDVNVALHWTDAAAQGITDPNELVVAMYNDPLNPSPDFPTGWTSIGNGGVQIDGASGSVSNIGTCPPPWEVDNFTFGTLSEEGRFLPVDMTSFNARKQGLQVSIDWSTSSETDASHFELQKSTNGQDFNEIKQIQAKGVNGTQAYYQHLDVNPIEGLNYYRLRQVDLNGMAVLSDVIAVYFEEEIDLTVFPNPTTDHFTLRGEYLNKAKALKVYNNFGSVLFQKNITIQEGYLNVDFAEIDIYRPGIYYVEIISKSKSSTVRMIKE